MKLTKSKLIALMLGLIIVISLSVFAITTQVSNVAAADTATADTTNDSNNTSSDEFVVLDSQNIVPATYNFTKLNDEECSVRISNKTTATTAVIPAFGEINGVKYRVVEIAANGFMSSTNLVNLDLYLENFAMCSPITTYSNSKEAYTYDTITMTTSNNSALNLYTYHQVDVYGSAAKRISGYSYDGSHAINCSKLNIMSADNLNLYGGYGSTTSRNAYAISASTTSYQCDSSKVHIYNR